MQSNFSNSKPPFHARALMKTKRALFIKPVLKMYDAIIYIISV